MTLLDDLLRRQQQRLAMLQTRSQLEDWAAEVVQHGRPLVAVDFGEQVFKRWQIDAPVGDWAEAHTQQYTVRPYGEAPPMEVSPFVPPQRQMSSARQGAAEWSQRAPEKPQQATDVDAMRRELERLGWKKS